VVVAGGATTAAAVCFSEGATCVTDVPDARDILQASDNSFILPKRVAPVEQEP